MLQLIRKKETHTRSAADRAEIAAAYVRCRRRQSRRRKAKLAESKTENIPLLPNKTSVRVRVRVRVRVIKTK